MIQEIYDLVIPRNHFLRKLNKACIQFLEATRGDNFAA